MYGDMMYCKNCGKTFKDTWIMHDTRTEKVMTNCPHCRCMHTTNATAFIEKYESLNKKQLGGIAKNKGKFLYESFKNMYIFFKRKQKIFNLKNMNKLTRKEIFYTSEVLNKWQ